MRKILFFALASFFYLSPVSHAGDPPDTGGQFAPLFNGRDLTGWYTFLQKHGKNADPDHLITIENGVIHLYKNVADSEHVVMGYIGTDKEYGEYHLRVQYRWGTKKFQPRYALKRDAGIYYHIQGADAVWPQALQFQVEQTNVGDLIALQGFGFDTWVDPKTRGDKMLTFLDATHGGVAWAHGGKADVYQKHLAGEWELDGWNTAEVIAKGDTVTHILNGHVVNRGQGVRLIDRAHPEVPARTVTRGRIALELEAAEIEFRNVEIRQLDAAADKARGENIKAGAAAKALVADDSQVIGGGIGPGHAKGQEGELRASAVVIEAADGSKACLVACDVLMVERDILDDAARQISAATGIPFDHILINCTHTHHAPTTVTVHGYHREDAFTRQVGQMCVAAASEASARLRPVTLRFRLGEESSVGKNSRLLLKDGTIFWVGPHEDAVRPTGPFDPELPVLALVDALGKPEAVLFNHSTHTIGTVKPGVRSPSFYGLAAQELEKERGGTFLFFEGASGSTHNLDVTTAEAVHRIKAAVSDALERTEPRSVPSIRGKRAEIELRYRTFDESTEDAAVVAYCTKRQPAPYHEQTIAIFRKMRQILAPRRGQARKTWVQAIVVGDIALVGVPCEFFTVLGQDIKRLSPYRYTYVFELANDYVGYIPDARSFDRGGYQVWTGLHSFMARGSGEALVASAVGLLRELHDAQIVMIGDLIEDDREIASRNIMMTLACFGLRARCLAAAVLVVAAGAVHAERAPTPDEERAALRLADPSLTIELVAAEPEVASPVAVAWDEQGRLYVVEMTDYPIAPDGGRIKRLEDRDGDGYYEHASVFADKLHWPTGVLPWNGGVLVTAAPDLLFFKDTDGDGRADVRTVILTGFAEGNQQLRVNSPVWGLDNAVYLANGRSGGAVRRPSDPPAKAVPIPRNDVRLDPVSGAFAPVAGFSQFGLARDDWGDRFPSWNTVPIRHVVLELSDSAVDPRTVADILDMSDGGRVYSLAPAQRRFNVETVAYFNASCGPAIYRGDLLGDAYRGHAFACEPLTSVVFHRRLDPLGPTYVARRVEHEKTTEFLASAHPWFRPVNLATGPDGALYVVDFCRAWVEHPAFVPENQRHSVDFREGFEHGRIWRIFPRTLKTRSVACKPGSLDTEGLIRLLEHSNGWCRDTAQRLIVERHAPEAITGLRTLLARSELPQARTAALWSLHGLGAVDAATIRGELHDRHSRVREQAVRLAIASGRQSELAADLAALADDADARVRLHTAVALGGVDSEVARAALARVAARDADSPWTEAAVLTAIAPRPVQFLDTLATRERGWLTTTSRQQSAFLTRLGEFLGTRARTPEVMTALERALSRCAEPAAFALIAGLAESQPHTAGPAVNWPWLKEAPTAIRTEIEKLCKAAAAAAIDGARPSWVRASAFGMLQSMRDPALGNLIPALLDVSQPSELQTVAARAVAVEADRTVTDAVFARWDALALATRRVLLEVMTGSVSLAERLLDAVAGGTVAASELGPSARDSLRRLNAPALSARLAKLFPRAPGTDRREVLAHYQQALVLKPQPTRGRDLFNRHCLTCHARGGQGAKVGPDLMTVAGRPADDLLVAVLDPSREVAPDGIAVVVETREGRTLTGLLVEETAAALHLRRAEGLDDIIPRAEIEAVRSTGRSLMPDGLEQVLGPQDLADLIGFLKSPQTP